MYHRYWAPLPVTVDEEQTSDFRVSAESVHQHTASYASNTENRICISLNHADKTELEKLPGVGPITAERIIAYRKENGAFQSIEELTNVKGVGEKTFQKLEPYIQLD